MVKVYRRPRPARRIAAPDVARHDGSARERGYDAKWDALSAEYRRKHPFCEESERRGIIALGDVVDHIIPASEAPHLRYDPENMQTLTNALHNGWKRRLEAYAKKARKIEYLPVWCRKPETRPFAFRLEMPQTAQAEA